MQHAVEEEPAGPGFEVKADAKDVPTRSKKDPQKHRLVKLKRNVEVTRTVSDQYKGNQVTVDSSEVLKEGRHGHGHHRDSKRAHSPEPWSRRRRSRIDGKAQRKVGECV